MIRSKKKKIDAIECIHHDLSLSRSKFHLRESKNEVNTERKNSMNRKKTHSKNKLVFFLYLFLKYGIKTHKLCILMTIRDYFLD